MAGGERRQIRVEYWKWGARPHYQLSMSWLGEDEFGVWLWAPTGNVINKGDDWFAAPEASLGLVPRQGMWSAVWWFGDGEIELYVDINTTPEWDAADQRVSMVDLDLDVARFVGGRVEILDRDEFDEHRAEYGYPPEVVRAALRAAEEMRAMVAGGTEPFDMTTHRRWLAAAIAGAETTPPTGLRPPAAP